MTDEEKELKDEGSLDVSESNVDVASKEVQTLENGEEVKQIDLDAPDDTTSQTQLENIVDHKLPVTGLVEAALFLANKPMTVKELSELLRASEAGVKQALTNLQSKYNANSESAVEIFVNEEGKANMQLKQSYLAPVAKLSQTVELSRKATKILALVAKKGELLQSDLHKYFKGDIYTYVHEVVEKGYVTNVKEGRTRKLKPTKKFHETFQLG